jgi:hypothetical protein
MYIPSAATIGTWTTALTGSAWTGTIINSPA